MASEDSRAADNLATWSEIFTPPPQDNNSQDWTPDFASDGPVWTAHLGSDLSIDSPSSFFIQQPSSASWQFLPAASTSNATYGYSQWERLGEVFDSSSIIQIAAAAAGAADIDEQADPDKGTQQQEGNPQRSGSESEANLERSGSESEANLERSGSNTVESNREIGESGSEVITLKTQTKEPEPEELQKAETDWEAKARAAKSSVANRKRRREDEEDENNELKCDGCNGVFKAKRYLAAHVAKSSCVGTRNGELQCRLCGAKGTAKWSITHMAQEHYLEYFKNFEIIKK